MSIRKDAKTLGEYLHACGRCYEHIRLYDGWILVGYDDRSDRISTEEMLRVSSKILAINTALYEGGIRPENRLDSALRTHKKYKFPTSIQHQVGSARRKSRTIK